LKKNCIMRSFRIFTFYQILLGDQMKENEMGGASSMHVNDEKGTQNFKQHVLKELMWQTYTKMRGK